MDEIDSSKRILAKIPVRYVIVILSAIINCISYTMRSSINLTIVAMVKVTQNHTDYETCLAVNHTNNDYGEQFSTTKGDYEWSDSLQGIVLGAYYYGYVMSSVNAGQLADWIGPRLIIGLSVLVSAILTALIPICADWDAYAVVVLRLITGLVQGVLTPSIYTLLSYWIPQQERSTALAIIQVGGNIGAVITMPLSAYLCQHGFAGGWPSVYYVLGTCGILCFIPWIFIIYNTPAEHPKITATELIHIQSNVSSLSAANKKIWTPWGAILTSAQVWTIAVTKFCAAWGNLFIMTKLPAYLRSILQMPLTNNGLINALIYTANSASLMLFGYASDAVERKKLLNRTVSRKLFEAIALSGAAVTLALVAAVKCDQTAVTTLLLLSMILLGVVAGGDSPIVVDIAPDYSGSVYGFTNSIASTPGFLAPLFVGIVLDSSDGDPMKKWNAMFLFASGVYVFGAIVFVTLVSSKPQPWGKRMLKTIDSSDRTIIANNNSKAIAINVFDEQNIYVTRENIELNLNNI